MDDFYPIGFFITFTVFLLLSIFRGEKTSYRGEYRENREAKTCEIWLRK